MTPAWWRLAAFAGRVLAHPDTFFALPELAFGLIPGAGCDRCYHLQRDHIDPVANGGLTSYVNNQLLCPPDHRIKTERDRKAGLLRRKERRSRRPDPTRASPSREHSRPRLQ